VASSSRISSGSSKRRPAAFASPPDAELFTEAVGRFGGELLPEERFEDWAIDRRDTVKATYVELLLALAAIERGRARLDAAIDALKRVVAVEPLHEDAQAQLLCLHGLAGRRHLAVAHYHRFRDLLKSELEAEPLPTTIEIYRSVVSGRICPSDRIAMDMASRGARFERERHAAALSSVPDASATPSRRTRPSTTNTERRASGKMLEPAIDVPARPPGGAVISWKRPRLGVPREEIGS
jgi:DNA-binding SARP family transcriptional activator